MMIMSKQDRRYALMNEIVELEKQFDAVEGRETEVYSRIVGYYRSVANWNKGKKEEYQHRTEFEVDFNQVNIPVAAQEQKSVEFTVTNFQGSISSYKLFYTDSCPNCPSVKNYMKTVHMPGAEINAATENGLKEAMKYNVMATPTVIFFDQTGGVVERVHTPEQIEAVL